VHVFQLLEILGPRVIGIYRIGGQVARRRRAVEGRQYTGIILVRIVVDMLPGRSAHQDPPVRGHGLKKDFLGQVQPGLIGNDLRI